MNPFDVARKVALKTVESTYAVDLLFQDGEENFTVKGRGVFSSTYDVVDTLTQQNFISAEPTLWMRTPIPDEAKIESLVKFKDKTWKIVEMQNDVDDSAINLLLNEVDDS